MIMCYEIISSMQHFLTPLVCTFLHTRNPFPFPGDGDLELQLTHREEVSGYTILTEPPGRGTFQYAA